MPTSPPARCRVPRCPGFAVREGYCSTHIQQIEARRRQRDSRPSAYRRGYNKTWQRIRLLHLARHPWCEGPGCQAKATEVHHIVAIVDGGTHSGTNLLSHCKRCHSRITARQVGWGGRNTAG